MTLQGLARRRSWRWAAALAPVALLAMLALLPGRAVAQEDHSGLTRASFRRNCLLCHSAAQPEGISPEILEGLHASSRLTPREAMPGISCLRRCDSCKLPDPDRVRP